MPWNKQLLPKPLLTFFLNHSDLLKFLNSKGHPKCLLLKELWKINLKNPKKVSTINLIHLKLKRRNKYQIKSLTNKWVLMFMVILLVQYQSLKQERIKLKNCLYNKLNQLNLQFKKNHLPHQFQSTFLKRRMINKEQMLDSMDQLLRSHHKSKNNLHKFNKNHLNPYQINLNLSNNQSSHRYIIKRKKIET